MGIRRAFTLVEILIVVLILGILAGLVMPQFATATQDAQREATITELQKLRRHIEVFEARNAGRLPDVEEGDGTWGQLVGNEYLTAPPINAWVGWENGRVVIFGDAPDPEYHTEYGWIFDPVSGQVWAAAYDANDEPYPRP